MGTDAQQLFPAEAGPETARTCPRAERRQLTWYCPQSHRYPDPVPQGIPSTEIHQRNAQIYQNHSGLVIRPPAN